MTYSPFKIHLGTSIKILASLYLTNRHLLNTYSYVLKISMTGIFKLSMDIVLIVVGNNLSNCGMTIIVHLT